MKQNLLLAAGIGLLSPTVMADVPQTLKSQPPLYKPSSRSAAPVDITANSYGASQLAPDALELGQKAPDFELPTVNGSNYQLSEADGIQVIIFYRGHW